MPTTYDQKNFCLEFASDTIFFIAYVHIYLDEVIEVQETAIENENGTFSLIDNISLKDAQNYYDEWVEDQQEQAAEAAEERHQNAAFYNAMPTSSEWSEY